MNENEIESNHYNATFVPLDNDDVVMLGSSGRCDNIPFTMTQPVYLIDDRFKRWVRFKGVCGDDVRFEQFGSPKLLHYPLHMYGRVWKVMTMREKVEEMSDQ